MRLDSFGSFGFHFIESVPSSPIQLHGVGHEIHYSDYNWANQDRTYGQYLFQYTLDGAGCLEQNKQIYDIKKEQAILLHLPGPERYFLPESCHPDAPGKWHFLWIIFSGRAAEPYCQYIKGKWGSLFSLCQHSPAIEILKKLYSQASLGSITTPYLAEEMTFSFLSRLCSCLSAPAEQYSKRVQDALLILKEEFSTLEGVSVLADRLGVSFAHLSREFSQETGSTLLDTLLKIRMQHAVLLLRDNSLSIDETARRCGFSCGNYFSKVFRQHFSMSPGQFRQNSLLRLYSDIMI